MSHFEVVTRYSPELIEQSVEFPSQSALISAMTKNVIRLQDEGVKQALINLGWVPPEKGLMLNDNIRLDLMMSIMSICKRYSNMELSHFYAEVDDGKCQMVAHYPGNGVFFPTRNVVVNQWGRVDALGIAKTIARDLNTIFGLEDPT